MSQGRRWCYTLNNWTSQEGLDLCAVASVYHIVGKEIGENGTPHLQGYIVFKSAKRLSGVKKLNNRCHWELAKGTTEQNVVYCSKDGNFHEVGVRPKTPKEIGEDQHTRWLDVIRSAKEGTCAEEYPREFIQYNSTVNRLYAPDIGTIDQYNGLWWWGPPGTGKSRKARDDHPDLYDKLLNKWWDGYVDEDVVLIDDIDTTHTTMGLFLKRYADHYPFRAEYKGGSKVIRPKTIIVTSNYSIDEIFGKETEMAKAIHRRFKVTKFHSFTVEG